MDTVALSRKSLADESRQAVPSLKIAGFGACMITGYPHQGGGFFETACGMVEKRLSWPVQSTVVSLGGFPAPRAEKYLRKRLFDFNPQYVVIQLGATDAQCPIRAGSRPNDNNACKFGANGISIGSAPGTTSYHAQPATALSPIRWHVVSLIGSLRRIEPITPLSCYSAAIERMVEDCRSAGIRPVVLSPFVYGSGYTMRKAIAYVTALRELACKTQDMILVDCVRLLADLPKRRILQHDGFHLSRFGQNIVGEAVGNAIIEDVLGSNFEDMRPQKCG